MKHSVLLALVISPGLGAGLHAQTTRREIFGGGLLFPSLVASREEPSLRNSLLATRGTPPYNSLIGLTEQGATISLYRETRPGGTAVELSIQGSASAQFDMLGSRWTLLNADYTFAYPVTMRRGASVVRVRPYHRSSHLGDRYLFRADARSFDSTGFRREALEVLYARTLGDSAASATLYGGGEYAYSVTPKAMKRSGARLGADAVRRFHQFGSVARASWVAGTEVGAMAEQGWRLGISLRAGVEVGRASGELPGGRRYRALLEFYDGPSTFGHFSRRDTIRSFGVGCIVVL